MMLQKCLTVIFTTINLKYHYHIRRAQGIARVNTVECAHRLAAQNQQLKMNGNSESLFVFVVIFVVFFLCQQVARTCVILGGVLLFSVVAFFVCCMLLTQYITTYFFNMV